MRVVAGELRGRRLTSPPAGEEVRPTSDRAREALFSMLGSVEGSSVLDLFCGTAALAIEALSRGAADAVCVDTDTRAARRNVEALGLGDRCRVVPVDALQFARSEDSVFDLILCDPPYTIAALIEAELEQLLPPRLAPGGRLVLESPAASPLDLDRGGRLELDRDRRYGTASIRIWRDRS